MAEAGDQIDRSLRLAVAPVVEDRIGLADPVRRAPEVHRHVETGVNSQLVGQIDRRGAGRWNVGVSRISLADHRVGAGQRCHSSRPVETDAVVRVSAGDAAVLVTGRQIGEHGHRQLAGRIDSGESELRGQVHIAHAAIAEAALIQPAIDEAGPIAALAGEFIERHHPRYFPPVGQSKAGRKAQARERVAHVLVGSPGGRYEIGRRSSEQPPILIVDAE